MSDDLTLEEIFAPCRGWVDFLTREASVRNGVNVLDGAHVDSIWQNVYLDAGQLRLTDREWIWHEDIPLNVIIIRGIYYFFADARTSSGTGKALNARSGHLLIERVAAALGVRLNHKDFDAFVELEAEIQSIVFGTDKNRKRTYLRWFLIDRPTLALFHRLKKRFSAVSSQVTLRLGGS